MLSQPTHFSPKEALVLGLLLTKGELFGLQMIEESNGDLKRGTIYITLQRLEEKGIIESRQEQRTDGQPGIPRRLYRLTATGERKFLIWTRYAEKLRIARTKKKQTAIYATAGEYYG